MTTAEVADDFAQHAHLFTEMLRADGPVRLVRMPRGLTCYVVTGFAEARAVLADPRLRKNSARARELFEAKLPGEAAQGGLGQDLSFHMLNSDPPDHTRLRKLVNKAFTARTVARLRPRVEEITAELLDALAGRERADLLPSFAAPLPITVICELLGVRPEDRSDFSDWSKTLLSSSAPEDVRHAAQSMLTYLTGLIAQKRAEPAEDLLSDLVHATDDGDSLSEPELVSMAFLLLVAGHETTVNLIANGVLALLREPEQLARLRAEPQLLPNAVEEFLRFDGPIHLATLRFTAEPVEVGGVPIPAGEFVLVSLLGANRDAERYPEPDRLDVTRAAGGHLAFGHGIHYCVGAPLARLEAEIALGGLLARFPGLALDVKPDELVYRSSSLIHGLEALPVRLC
ncbi:cytochrome P450 family protein [Amycolatopsis australiensis]|uniref:Cytochrome P450 n=1 Tax=Amycolatopsis australiensis TaxID=546364 RepID=A0A1K1T2N2_9PSEU|nr:cytochrome P450 [Amycolatopsis australiensis]SFW90599.1 Cytochrome P450 [Amycolatopsis australiensis]